jgi:hypothetical protein
VALGGGFPGELILRRAFATAEIRRRRRCQLSKCCHLCFAYGDQGPPRRARNEVMEEHTDTTTTADLERLSPEEGLALLERRARERFGIGADEFRRRWESGELDPDKDPGALEVAMLLPFGRS